MRKADIALWLLVLASCTFACVMAFGDEVTEPNVTLSLDCKGELRAVCRPGFDCVTYPFEVPQEQLGDFLGAITPVIEKYRCDEVETKIPVPKGTEVAHVETLRTD